MQSYSIVAFFFKKRCCIYATILCGISYFEKNIFSMVECFEHLYKSQGQRAMAKAYRSPQHECFVVTSLSCNSFNGNETFGQVRLNSCTR